MEDYLELHNAIKRSDVSLVSSLAKDQTFHSFSPLQLALSYNNMEIVKIIAEKSNLNNYNVLCVAVERSTLEIVRYLIDKGAPITKHALTIAIRIERVRVVEFFRERGFKDYGLACEIALQLNNIKMLKYLHENGYIWTKMLYEMMIRHHYPLSIWKYLYENGYFEDIKYKYKDGDFLFIGDKISEYCHDNSIPSIWKCKRKKKRCKLCTKQALRDSWQIEIDENGSYKEYSNLIQWLPNEILDDISSFL